MFLLSAEILQANDSLTQVINLYRQLVKGEDVSKDGLTTSPQTGLYMGMWFKVLPFLPGISVDIKIINGFFHLEFRRQ